MFMRINNNILSPFTNSFVIFYLDDILVYNSDMGGAHITFYVGVRGIKEVKFFIKFQEV